MFDFRYHLASLTAVFLALVIGILVGVGLSGRGFVDDAERTRLGNDIADLKRERDDARQALRAVERRGQATSDYVEETYPALVPGRLDGSRVAVVFVGSVDQSVSFAVEEAVRDAGGRIVRMRALRVPIEAESLEDALDETPALRRYAGPDELEAVGHDLGRELVAGGRTPLWDAVEGTLAEEQDGRAATVADAVVVVRSVEPQRGATQDFLSGLYQGLARSGVPAVGAEAVERAASAVPAFARAGLSTVDSVDTPAGQLALVLLLAGATPGRYGVAETATNGVLPPIDSVPPSGG